MASTPRVDQRIHYQTYGDEYVGTVVASQEGSFTLANWHARYEDTETVYRPGAGEDIQIRVNRGDSWYPVPTDFQLG